MDVLIKKTIDFFEFELIIDKKIRTAIELAIFNIFLTYLHGVDN